MDGLEMRFLSAVRTRSMSLSIMKLSSGSREELWTVLARMSSTSTRRSSSYSLAKELNP